MAGVTFTALRQRLFVMALAGCDVICFACYILPTQTEYIPPSQETAQEFSTEPASRKSQ
jgi:hypothetical protein